MNDNRLTYNKKNYDVGDNQTFFGNGFLDKLFKINKMNFIKRWWYKRKLAKELDHIAPSVQELKWMVEVIDMLSILYFYDNNPNKSPIATEHISTKQQKQIRGVFLNTYKSVQSDSINCIILNISEYTRIRIRISNEYVKVTKIRVTVENQKGEIRAQYEWNSDDPSVAIQDEYDEVFFINLENELMNRYKNLLLSCIK